MATLKKGEVIISMGDLNFKTMEFFRIYWALFLSIVLHWQFLLFWGETKTEFSKEKTGPYVLAAFRSPKGMGENKKVSKKINEKILKESSYQESSKNETVGSNSQNLDSTGRNQREDYERFFMDVRNGVEIEMSKTKALRPQRRGDLVVVLTVEPSGTIREVELEQSSGSLKLDTYVVTTIKNMPALEHIPETLKREKLVFKIPLSFKTL